ncbi:MAG TPA: hypothetical protein VIK21_10075 [Desulfuromonadaceae bacterium]
MNPVLINRISALTKLLSAKKAQKLTSNLLKNLLLIILLLLFPAQLPALEAPPLTGLVNDLARVLSPDYS